jgi:hypothetical protein
MRDSMRRPVEKCNWRNTITITITITGVGITTTIIIIGVGFTTTTTTITTTIAARSSVCPALAVWSFVN